MGSHAATTAVAIAMLALGSTSCGDTPEKSSVAASECVPAPTNGPGVGATPESRSALEVRVYDLVTHRTSVVAGVDDAAGLAWFPSGDRLAADAPQLVVIPVPAQAGGKAGVLFDGATQGATLSPDGKWIAFEAIVEGGDRDLCIIPAAGGVARNLTSDDPQNYAPFWLDSQHLIFSQDVANRERSERFVVNLDGQRRAATTAERNVDANTFGSRRAWKLVHEGAQGSPEFPLGATARLAGPEGRTIDIPPPTGIAPGQYVENRYDASGDSGVAVVTRITSVYSSGELASALTTIWIADLGRGTIAVVPSRSGPCPATECEPFARISPAGRQLAFVVPRVPRLED